MFNVPNKSKAEKLAELSAEQIKQIQAITDDAISNFKGELTQLESTLGMLNMGHHFGWKVLYLVHSKRTIRSLTTTVFNPTFDRINLVSNSRGR